MNGVQAPVSARPDQPEAQASALAAARQLLAGTAEAITPGSPPPSCWPAFSGTARNWLPWSPPAPQVDVWPAGDRLCQPGSRHRSAPRTAHLPGHGLAASSVGHNDDQQGLASATAACSEVARCGYSTLVAS